MWMSGLDNQSKKKKKKEYRRLCVQPIRYIDRKFMMYQVGNAGSVNSYSLCIDPNPMICDTNLDVPHFPQVDDVVTVHSDLSYFVVAEVDAKNRTFLCHPLKKVGHSNPRWTKASELVTYSFEALKSNVAFNTN